MIVTEEEYFWNSFSSEIRLRLVHKLNSTEKIEEIEYNPLYSKIDLENIGVSGHSQGGGVVFNSVTEQKRGNIIKTKINE